MHAITYKISYESIEMLVNSIFQMLMSSGTAAFRVSDYFSENIKEAVLGAGIKETGKTFVVSWTLSPSGGACLKKYGDRAIWKDRYLTDGKTREEMSALLKAIIEESERLVEKNL